MEEFFARLKEHKTVQWTLGYVAVSFALIPVLDITASRFDWSQTAVRCIIIALGTGFFTFLRKIGYAPEQLAKIQFTVTLPGAADATGEAASPAVETSTTTATPTPAPTYATTAATQQP